MRVPVQVRYRIPAVLRILLLCLFAPAAVVLAQENPPAPAGATQESPFVTNSEFVYRVVSGVLLEAAERTPEEHYDFRPTDSVRTFGQIVGHVADAQYMFCSVAIGEKNPAPQIEKTRTSKAEIISALQEAFTYCGRLYDSMTDTSAAQMVKLMGRDMPKLGVLTVNQSHLMEHYGNLVTYMRMKEMLPPTSDPEFMGRFRE